MKNAPKPTLNPTSEQTFELEGVGPWNFQKRLRTAQELQRSGKIAEACEERFKAVQLIEELLPEDEEINLEFNHANSRAALELIHASAIDHFLIGDFELSAALLELLLELDPEDHLEGVMLLAFDYVELQEYELYEELLNDISDKEPGRSILQLWAAFCRTKSLAAGELHHLKSRFAPYFEEFTSTDHPTDESFVREINSERPSPRARARELWLQTEPLWARHPDFIEALQGAK